MFGVQLYKNNARVLLSCILSILNSDWLQHARSVRGMYEYSIGWLQFHGAQIYILKYFLIILGLFIPKTIGPISSLLVHTWMSFNIESEFSNINLKSLSCWKTLKKILLDFNPLWEWTWLFTLCRQVWNVCAAFSLWEHTRMS